MTRRVRVQKYEKLFDNGRYLGEWTLVGDGDADFLGIGVDFEELEFGVGNFSTAIIERDDGTVENVPVELIKFIKE